MANKSPTQYRRLKRVQADDREDAADLAETAFPRYQVRRATTHRRGETRMRRWLPLT